MTPCIEELRSKPAVLWNFAYSKGSWWAGDVKEQKKWQHWQLLGNCASYGWVSTQLPVHKWHKCKCRVALAVDSVAVWEDNAKSYQKVYNLVSFVSTKKKVRAYSQFSLTRVDIAAEIVPLSLFWSSSLIHQIQISWKCVRGGAQSQHLVKHMTSTEEFGPNMGHTDLTAWSALIFAAELCLSGHCFGATCKKKLESMREERMTNTN